MRHPRNLILSPGSGSDGRPMCASLVTATIVVMIPMRISGFLRGLSARLFSVAVVAARHAAEIFRNFAPGLW